MATNANNFGTLQGGSRHGEGEEQRERRHSARGGVPGVAAASVPIGNLGPTQPNCMVPGLGPPPISWKRGPVEHPVTPSGSGTNLATMVASSSNMAPPPPSSSQQQTAVVNNSTGSNFVLN